ncbi:MarR family transcriptional regulator [Propionicimonas sp. T2.31MG-18]|jgi:DNA-binding IclR family transcriptional regulator|uniref:MarR family transcriptional regulator n=1 Tax=Propionicimonas sp. T2.31MG-18 TaxID=3157620 RepID=UPI00366C73C8
MSTSGWTFLSNYGHVLVALSTYPDARMRDIADMVGITERAVQQIVRELVDQGYVFKDKDGRRNRYHIAHHAHLRHELEAGVSLGEFVALARRPVDRARLPRPSKPIHRGGLEMAGPADSAPA